jgi:hypothetical protein
MMQHKFYDDGGSGSRWYMYTYVEKKTIHHIYMQA